jgi:hypothetical protein
MEIFRLFGSILIDSSEAEKSISKTGKEAEGLGSKLKSGIQTAAKWAAGVVAGATAVGAAMVAAAKDTAATADEIDKASQRMKMDAESYQELAYAAEMSGVSMSTLESAAKKLEGTDLNMEDALAEIYALEDAEERAAKAAELFGDKVAYEMTPMLNASGEEMADMAKEAHDLGLVMGDEAVKNGAAMNDMFTKVEDSLGALKNGLMAEFMPYIMEILDWLIKAMPKISETVKKVMDKIMPIVKPILNAVVKVVEAVFALLDGDFAGFADAILGALKGLGEGLWNAGKAAFELLWDGIKSVWDSISNWVSEKVGWLADKIMFWKKGSEEMTEESYGTTSAYSGTSGGGRSFSGASAGGSSSSGDLTVSLNIDGKAFAQATYNSYQNEAKRRGPSLVTT